MVIPIEVGYHFVMPMTARPASISEIAPLREQFLNRARCQIVRWSLLPRGLAYAVAVCEGTDLIGYGVVSTVEEEETLIECLGNETVDTVDVARSVLGHTGAPCVEAQTNMPVMWSILGSREGEEIPGPLLFGEGATTDWEATGAIFRVRKPDDQIFIHHHEPVGSLVIDVDGVVVATGGYLTHYNPPYADLYLEVHPDHRRQGYGAYLSQEIQKACRSENLIPAARCAPENIASARCTEKAGMPQCGQMITKRLSR